MVTDRKAEVNFQRPFLPLKSTVNFDKTIYNALKLKNLLDCS